MELNGVPEIKVPDLKDILPKVPSEGRGVQVSHDENGAVASMRMGDKPLDPLHVGGTDRYVTARFDANGKLQVTTSYPESCFPSSRAGAKTDDLVKLRNALLEKLVTMDPASAEAKELHKLSDALHDQILLQVGEDVFDKTDHPEHPTPANVVQW